MKTRKDADYNRTHTQERLKERYNTELSDIEYKTMCAALQNKQKCFPAKEEGERLTLLTWLKGKPTLLVYNENTKLVETALPPQGIVLLVTELYRHYYT